jgi:rhomboid family GlyGly-CTERM serine protease
VPSSADARRPWVALAVALALGALLVFFAGAGARDALEWQPARVLAEPWRAVSAPWVHYSALHLEANLAGTAVVAALGWFAGAQRRIVVAWLIAWPLTQLGLLARPDLLHYGGLSGVLHAGVACIGWQLAVHARGRRQIVGALVLLGLLAKIASESPWGAALRQPPGWDIATAPFAHASGFVAGLFAAAICDAAARRDARSPRRADTTL